MARLAEGAVERLHPTAPRSGGARGRGSRRRTRPPCRSGANRLASVTTEVNRMAGNLPGSSRGTGVQQLMVRARNTATLAVALVLACVSVSGQQSETRQALIRRIDRIFTTSDFEPPRFGPARWLPD